MQQQQDFQIISLLESQGFEIKGKYILKRNRHNHLDVCGNLNDHSIYFHATSGIYPYDAGTSYSFHRLLKDYNTTLVSDAELQRISAKRIKDKAADEAKKGVTAAEYHKITDDNHNFNLQKLLDFFHKNKKNNLLHVPTVWQNENNVKARYKRTYFPLFDEDQNFITAQIIQYKTDLKRDRNTNPYYLKSNGNIGLYRRNTYDHNKLSIIVESPKLAELGSLILPKFNWFATFGSEKFKTIDLSFLDPATTFVLPDLDAFDEWKETTTTRWNFNIIDIFQKELSNFSIEIQKGNSDFADLILQYLQCKNDTSLDSVFYKIYNALINLLSDDKYLLSLNTPLIENYNTELGFKEKKRKQIKFISCIPANFFEDTKRNYKQSAQGGYSIKTKYFEVFHENFELISCSFDICKEQTEIEFIENLERCFRILRYLNRDDYLELFDIVLSNIQTKGNYLFNQKYIKEALVPIWSKIHPEDIEEFIKERNFNYTGGGDFNNYQFLDELRKAKKLYLINSQLHAILPIVKAGVNEWKFIDKAQLGLKKEAGNEYIFNLINRFNLASCGSINKSICKVVQKIVTFNITIYKHHYKTHNSDLSVNEVYKITGANRRTLSHLLKFERNEALIESLLLEINHLLDNYNSFDFEKVNIKGKIHNSAVPIFKKPAAQYYLSPADAFLCDPTLEAIQKGFKELTMDQSRLNCSFEDAKQNGADFFLSWYIFHNPDIKEEDRDYLRKHKLGFYQDKFNFTKVGAA